MAASAQISYSTPGTELIYILLVQGVDRDRANFYPAGRTEGPTNHMLTGGPPPPDEGWIPSLCRACETALCGFVRAKPESTAKPIDETCISCQARTNELHELTQFPPEPSQEAASPPLQHTQPTFDVPSAGISDDLGISLDTFREIQLLQTREITAEDYDLLLLLHQRPNTTVFEEHELYKVSRSFDANCDFDASTCTICLGPMSSADELAQLLCRGQHVFHRQCIFEWLRTASRCCPIDKQELSVPTS